MEAAARVNPALADGARIPYVWSPPARRSAFGDVALVAFLLAQCFDGALTYVGVLTFGLGIEANPIVAGLMKHLGHEAALLSAKLVASGLGIALHLRQVHRAVALLAIFYLLVAILPWTAILYL
jgi:hypothetical protein